MGDISLVAQVVVFHNTRAFDQLVKKHRFVQEFVQLLNLALPYCL